MGNKGYWKIAEAKHKDDLVAVNLARAETIWVDGANVMRCYFDTDGYVLENFESKEDADAAFLKLIKELNGNS